MMTNHDNNHIDNTASRGPVPRRSSRGPAHPTFRNSYSIYEAMRSDSERINAVDTRRSNDAARDRLCDIADEDETVDLSSVTTKEDLKKLWVSDPFLYYSIPEIHKNAYRVDSDEDEDEAELQRVYGVAPSGMPRVPAADQVNQRQPQRQQHPQQEPSERNDEQTHEESRPPRRRSSNTARNLSCPAGMLANADISYALFHGGTAVVTRRHRLSTEAHPSLIVDVVLSDEELSDDEDFDIEDDDDFEEPLMGVLKRMSSTRILGHLNN